MEQDTHDEAHVGHSDDAGDKHRPSGIARLGILDELHNNHKREQRANGHEGVAVRQIAAGRATHGLRLHYLAPKKRWVNVAMKLISMNRPKTASAVARMATESPRSPGGLKKPRP